VAGLATAFGSGAMTNSIAEAAESSVFLLTGTNTTENHPVIATKLKQAVNKGAKLILVDPRNIEIAKFATIHLRQRPGTDVAWINGMMNVIIEEGLYDRDYVAGRTEGFEKMKEAVKKYTPEYVEKISGITAADLIEAARLFATSKPAAVYYAMGITQHTTGTDNVMSLANLAMLTGNVGVAGGGVNPLRGQNNVQGACDMGALPNVFCGYQRVIDEAVRAKFTEAWKPVMPLSEKVGLTIVEMTNAVHEGKLKALYFMGENPMVSDPDTAHVRESLKKADFIVCQDIFMNETTELADVVFPAASFAEKDGTFTNTERRVQRVRRAVGPIGESRPDWKIIADIAARMGYPMDYRTSKDIFEEIRKVTPSYAGISYERIDNGGIQWPCPNEEHPGTRFLHKDKFVRGLGLFNAIEFKEAMELPDKEYPLILTTGRILYQYHTGTMSRRSEGLNFRSKGPFFEINPKDATTYGVGDGKNVFISSRRGSVEVRAWVTDRVKPGTIFMPFHYAEAAANVLTNTFLDPIGKIPEYKVSAVKIDQKQKRAAG
jgi:formate dehydrogenase alpha subunit